MYGQGPPAPQQNSQFRDNHVMRQEQDFMEQERNFARQGAEGAGVLDNVDMSHIPQTQIGPPPAQDAGPIRNSMAREPTF